MPVNSRLIGGLKHSSISIGGIHDVGSVLRYVKPIPFIFFLRAKQIGYFFSFKMIKVYECRSLKRISSLTADCLVERTDELIVRLDFLPHLCALLFEDIFLIVRAKLL